MTTRSRLRSSDLASLGSHGLRAYPVRAVLSGLGISIGIAAMLAVVGISSSSQALVQQKLESLGTGMLTLSAGTDVFGNDVKLDASAVQRIERINGIRSVSWTADLSRIHAYRNQYVDPGITGGLKVTVGGGDLLQSSGARLFRGSFPQAVADDYPVAVLGVDAAERLGVDDVGAVISVGGHDFAVAGLLKHSDLAPELDSDILVGESIAKRWLEYDGHPTTIYTASTDDSVLTVRQLLPATVDPQEASGVKISRPSDALSAANTVDKAFTGLLLGVGSIALLVGGIGVANTMVISVLERRHEIGLRRSLGATRGHIRSQFLVEAMLLSAYGGAAGVLFGWLTTAVVARSNGWLVTMPPAFLVAGALVPICVGAVAGVLPAVRAARTSPTVALAS